MIRYLKVETYAKRTNGRALRKAFLLNVEIKCGCHEFIRHSIRDSAKKDIAHRSVDESSAWPSMIFKGHLNRKEDLCYLNDHCMLKK